MKKFIAALLSILLVASPVAAGPLTLLKVGSAPVAAGGCSQATTFLARTSGLSGTDVTNYTNLICGLQSDGVGCGTVLAALYVLAAPNSATSLLNLCSTSFSLTLQGTTPPAFLANVGYQGNPGGNAYIDTGIAPSALISAGTAGITVNSFTVGGYDISVFPGVNDDNFIWAADDGLGNGSISMVPLCDFFGGLKACWDINESDANGDAVTNALTGALYVTTRTGSTTKAVYQNGVSLGTGSQPSTTGSTTSICIFGFCEGDSNDGISFFFVGSGVNSTQAGLISARINTFATALGINTY